MRLTLAAIAAAALLCFATAAAEQSHSNPWLLSWIPAYCCVTNDCCWEIGSDEVQSLGDDKWLVKTTGQVKERTGYSPDGRYYRCACDYEQDKGTWLRHLGAHTRCLFTPMHSSRRPSADFISSANLSVEKVKW